MRTADPGHARGSEGANLPSCPRPIPPPRPVKGDFHSMKQYRRHRLKRAARFLLRVHPLIGARHLDSHIGKENSRRLAVRRTAMVGGEKDRPRLLVARPGGGDIAWLLGSSAMINEL